MLIMPEVDYIAPYPKLSDALTPVLIIVRLSCLGVAVGSILTALSRISSRARAVV
jgi:hypothetical protein